ncbi:MAG: hypothetical protein JWO37_4114 [Acidimicrobiales bacterium]|nr:hypothetical protein [Acidimicrobiales bacterium]
MLLPRKIPFSFRRAAGAAALALIASVATPSVTSAGSAPAVSAHIDPCSYLSNAAASVALSVQLSENMQHARVSNGVCRYSVPGRPDTLAFVYLVTGKAAALRRFAELLRLSGKRSQAVAGVGDAAYAVGSNVFAVRGDTLIVVSVAEPGASRPTLRLASIALARSVANGRVAASCTSRRYSAQVRNAAR